MIKPAKNKIEKIKIRDFGAKSRNILENRKNKL